jgi:hypothetical protein
MEHYNSVARTLIARPDRYTAPDNIARWVVTLNDWRLANYQPTQGLDSRTSSASAKRLAEVIPARVAQEKVQELLRTQLNATTAVLTGWLREELRSRIGLRLLNVGSYEMVAITASGFIREAANILQGHGSTTIGQPRSLG